MTRIHITPTSLAVTLCVLTVLNLNLSAATNQWDIDADGNWGTDINWSLGVIPTTADDVVIDRPGADVTVTHDAGVTTIQSLTATEGLNLQTSSFNLIAGTSTISGSFMIATATLSTSGTTTSFSASGATTINAATLIAADGSTISLPNATDYNDPANTITDWQAFDGATLNLANLTNFAKGRARLRSQGLGSTIDLTATPSIPPGASILLRDNGQLTAPSITTLNAVALTLTLGADYDFPKQLSSFKNALLTVAANTTDTNFSNLTDITTAEILVDAAGRLNLPNVVAYHDVTNKIVTWKTLGGSTLDLNNLATPTLGKIRISADGAGSTVNMPLVAALPPASTITLIDNGAITTAPTFNTLNLAGLTLVNGGAYPWPAQLTTFTSSTLTADNNTLTDLANITEIAKSSLTATNAGVINLPGVTAINDPTHKSATWQAINTGAINLSNLTDITASRIHVLANGAGTTIDLSALTTFAGFGTSSIHARNGGTITLSPAGTTLTDVDLILDDTGTLSTGPIELLANARITGPGATFIPVVTNTAGIVAPGASPGTLNLTAYTQGAAGTLDIEFANLPAPTPASATPGTDFDLLSVTGGVALDGKLNLDFLGAFEPAIGDTFTPIIAASITGVFTTVDGAVVNDNLALVPLYNGTDVTLRASIPGDTNFDNKVSVADLSTFALNFGTSPGGNAWALGDFNSDAQINDDDLMLLALNFGTDLDAGLAAVGLSLDAATSLFGVELSVPEPSTVLLTIAGALAAAARRRPRPNL